MKKSNCLKRDLISLNDLTSGEIKQLFQMTKELKLKKKAKGRLPLQGKTLVLIFEKPSLRTRVTFEVAINQLGGKAIYLSPTDIKMGIRESISDIAKNLSCWVEGIIIRAFSQKTVVELSKNASIPVINALSDLEHPCQAIADLYTILEHKGKLKGIKLAYLGDGNNVCNSLILCSTKLGVDIRVATPEGYEPKKEIVKKAKEEAKKAGSKIEILNDPKLVVKNADIVYTDVWVSMGQEKERDKRLEVFPPYQVNKRLINLAKDDCLVMHCLPAHREEEITSEVMDGPNSIIFKQAENRLHTEK
ncbi:MAG: ornithine carbamoyltransferase, partial [Armatimonadetes bacterium CG07_land_8_20_14_0_80_40_9]